jgi:two-component system nitrogen regulation response regulator GlnG
MQEMCKSVGRIAPQDVNVLILGESGTGKELVARALYHHSKRAQQPFLAINCAAIPESLLESELFGHEKGAFTGADRKRIGKFEQCSAGTLFLDEIGDMTPLTQTKVLRVLQDQTFERVGGNETIRTQVRVLAATNQDLARLVSEGRFRKDLFYRLNSVTIHVPPLRERIEDVAELANYFLFRFDRELGLDLRGIAPEVLELFQNYSWPGNVRELQGALKHAMLNASGHLILPEFLPPHLLQQPASPISSPEIKEQREHFDLVAQIEKAIERGSGHVYEEIISSVERVLFTRILQHTHGHQARASELLGMDRSTLRTHLKILGLTIDKTLTDATSG